LGKEEERETLSFEKKDTLGRGKNLKLKDWHTQ